MMNNRIFYLKLFVFFVALFLTNTFGLIYAEEEYESTALNLEQSIFSLRETTQKLSDKNQWYISEISTVNDNIQYLKRQIRELEREREDLFFGRNNVSSNIKDKAKEISLASKSVDRLTKELESLSYEQEMLESKLKIKREQAKQNKSEIKAKELDIDGIKAEILSLDNKLSALDSKKVITEVSEKIKFAEKNITEEQNQLKHLNKKHVKIFDLVEKLKNENNELKIKINAVQREHETAINEQEILSAQLLNFQETKDKESQKLDININKLKTKKAELENVLNEAKQKIANKNIDFEKYVKETSQLQENIDNIKRENRLLNSEINALNISLKGLEILEK